MTSTRPAATRSIPPLKVYRHRSGETYRCLHCELGRAVSFHDWAGEISPARKKQMIIRDLEHVLAEVKERL